MATSWSVRTSRPHTTCSLQYMLSTDRHSTLYAVLCVEILSLNSQEQAGKPLYLMYRAVKSQLEKGPIDVITGEARFV